MTKKHEIAQHVDDVMSMIEDAGGPLDVLVGFTDKAPEVVKGFIAMHCSNILLIEIPKLTMVQKQGPTISVEELARDNVASVADEAAKFARSNSKIANRNLTATVLDVSRELGEVLDKGMRRIILDDGKALRGPYLDILSLHAQMTKAISELALPEDYDDDNV